MEALWSRFNPAIQKAKQWIKEEQIGNPKFLYAEFSLCLNGSLPSFNGS